MSINVVEKIDVSVKVQHVLVSVSDKSGLDTFIPQLVEINPDLKIFSTGGTFGRIKEILGPRADTCLTQVSDYTGQPETQGGLVKTLDFKIYLGLLTETYNEAHQGDLKRTDSVPIDMVVVNLYPFKETISKPDVSVEQARAHATYIQAVNMVNSCIINGQQSGFSENIPQGFFPQLSPLGHSDSNYCYISHISVSYSPPMRILPRYLAYSPYSRYIWFSSSILRVFGARS